MKETNEPIKLTEEEKLEFRKNNICHICEEEIEESKVRDHCHLIGKYRGPAHSFVILIINYLLLFQSFFTTAPTMIHICL